MYIFLDESGDLTKGKEKYFIVGSFTVGDPVRIRNAFRRFQRRKFPKNFRYQQEIKFSNFLINDKLRLRTIKYISQQDVRIFYTYLKKQSIPEQYRKAHRIYETGKLYTQIVGDTLELYLPITEKELWIFHDPRPLKGVSWAEFSSDLKTRLLPDLPAKARLEIQRIDSKHSPLIQVADWICGALARCHEKKKHGEEFYLILKNNIIKEKELFQDYWLKRWSNKKSRSAQ